MQWRRCACRVRISAAQILDCGRYLYCFVRTSRHVGRLTSTCHKEAVCCWAWWGKPRLWRLAAGASGRSCLDSGLQPRPRACLAPAAAESGQVLLLRVFAQQRGTCPVWATPASNTCLLRHPPCCLLVSAASSLCAACRFVCCSHSPSSVPSSVPCCLCLGPPADPTATAQRQPFRPSALCAALCTTASPACSPFLVRLLSLTQPVRGRLSLARRRASAQALDALFHSGLAVVLSFCAPHTGYNSQLRASAGQEKSRGSKKPKNKKNKKKQKKQWPAENIIIHFRRLFLPTSLFLPPSLPPSLPPPQPTRTGHTRSAALSILPCVRQSSPPPRPLSRFLHSLLPTALGSVPPPCPHRRQARVPSTSPGFDSPRSAPPCPRHRLTAILTATPRQVIPSPSSAQSDLVTTAS